MPPPTIRTSTWVIRGRGYGFESSAVYLAGMINFGFTDLLLALLAILLVVAAVIDIRTFTISNRLNLAVALLALVYWWAVRLPLWPDAAVQLAIAGGVFLLLALAFSAGMMGGGDVKLAAALVLWFSPVNTVRFLVIMSIAGGLVTVVFLAIHRARRKDGRPKSPYGVAIAIGGLVILAQRFLNQFA
jgi:prepilin peptidase CpaA